jgi:outer membrane protein
MNKILLSCFIFLFLSAQGSRSQENSLDLETVLQLVLQNNSEIQRQSMQNEISRRQRWQALTGWLPRLNAEGGYVQTSGTPGIPDFVGANGLKERIAYLNLQQPLFDAEGYLNLRESKINENQQRLTLHLTRQQILFEAIQTYFEILKSRGEIHTFEQNLRSFQLIYEQSQMLYKTGEVAEIDVKKSLVEYLLQKNSLIKSRKSYQELLAYLKSLLNLPVEREVSVKEFEAKTIHLDSLTYYYQLALSNNLPLKILEMDLSRYQTEKTATALKHFPTTMVGFNYGWDTNDPLQKNDLGWQVYISMNLPIWHWGEIRAGRQIAELKYRQTHTEIAQFQKDIFLQIQSAYNECIIQQQQMQTMEESLDAAQQAVKMAGVGYREGTITNLDLINTQKLLTETSINCSNSIYDFYIAKANLYRVMGNITEDFEWIEK